MIVWRMHLEGEPETGPYFGAAGSDALVFDGNHPDSGPRPTPNELIEKDPFRAGFPEHLRCGFSSAEQIFRWFPDPLSWRVLGYSAWEISAWEVEDEDPDLLVGPNQCMFPLERARFLGTVMRVEPEVQT